MITPHIIKHNNRYRGPYESKSFNTYLDIKRALNTLVKEINNTESNISTLLDDVNNFDNKLRNEINLIKKEVCLNEKHDKQY